MKIALVLTAMALSAAPGTARADYPTQKSSDGKPQQSASVDLNGDGKKESIRLTPGSASGGSAKYTLSVGGKMLSGEAEGEEPACLYIVDINRADRYKEVVVQRDAMIDHREADVYWFDGRRLRLVGEMGADNFEFKGDGVVLEQRWAYFWHQTVRLQLDRSHKLARSARQDFTINAKGTVSKSLPLRASPDRARASLALAAGTKVTVVRNDGGQWYLLRASNGTQGWAEEEHVHHRISGLPFAG